MLIFQANWYLCIWRIVMEIHAHIYDIMKDIFCKYQDDPRMSSSVSIECTIQELPTDLLSPLLKHRNEHFT